MKFLLFFIIAFLTGCPKKDMKTLDEIEKEQQLRELLEEEDEIWDDLPEAGDDSSDENISD